MATPNPTSTFSFTLTHPLSKIYAPRLGTISLRRPDSTSAASSSSGSKGSNNASSSTRTQIQTPTFLTTTSRGIVPHLSRDNVRRTPAIRWVNVPFETFMEQNPPIPTVYPGPDPLHSFLGFEPGTTLLSMSARDPYDGRAMPTNGNAHLSVCSLRGVRKLTPTDWRTYALRSHPDVVFAMSDTPYTDPPYSQKRLTKSIERSRAWLATLMRPEPTPLPISSVTPSTSAGSDATSTPTSTNPPPNPTLDYNRPPLTILLHMSGGASLPARRAFANSLLEPLYGPELDTLNPDSSLKHPAAPAQPRIRTLDDGVAGYTFDLVPLRQSVEARERNESGVGTVGLLPPTTPSGSIALSSSYTTTSSIVDPSATTPSPSSPDSDPTHLPTHTTSLIPLIQSSLLPLPPTKLRLLNATEGPHEMLRWLGEVGVDVFDAGWVMRAAGCGIGLDFVFPVGEGLEKREIGHNLYDGRYALDFGPISNARDGLCGCAACSPGAAGSESEIYHGVDTPDFTAGLSKEGTIISSQPSSPTHHSRAYIHHLLHTHEMSAHTLLVMHNLAVLERFFEGVREVIGIISGSGVGSEAASIWDEEVRKFGEVHEDGFAVLERARTMWRDVELARGKGRLARERDREGAQI